MRSAPLTRLALGAIALCLACSDRLTLEDREWTLAELRGEGISALPDLPLPNLLLTGGQMTGFAGCNQMFGGYLLEGTELSFGPIGATRRACADASDLEIRFFQALEATTGYTLTPAALELWAGDDVVALLVPSEPA